VFSQPLERLVSLHSIILSMFW